MPIYNIRLYSQFCENVLTGMKSALDLQFHFFICLLMHTPDPYGKYLIQFIIAQFIKFSTVRVFIGSRRVQSSFGINSRMIRNIQNTQKIRSFYFDLLALNLPDLMIFR